MHSLQGARKRFYLVWNKLHFFFSSICKINVCQTNTVAADIQDFSCEIIWERGWEKRISSLFLYNLRTIYKLRTRREQKICTKRLLWHRFSAKRDEFWRLASLRLWPSALETCFGSILCKFTEERWRSFRFSFLGTSRKNANR